MKPPNNNTAILLLSSLKINMIIIKCKCFLQIQHKLVKSLHYSILDTCSIFSFLSFWTQQLQLDQVWPFASSVVSNGRVAKVEL